MSVRTITITAAIASQVRTVLIRTGPAGAAGGGGGGDLTSGPVTALGGVSAIANNALSIAKTNGLQTALDAKLAAAAAASTYQTLAREAALRTDPSLASGNVAVITGTLAPAYAGIYSFITQIGNAYYWGTGTPYDIQVGDRLLRIDVGTDTVLFAQYAYAGPGVPPNYSSSWTASLPGTTDPLAFAGNLTPAGSATGVATLAFFPIPGLYDGQLRVTPTGWDAWDAVDGWQPLDAHPTVAEILDAGTTGRAVLQAASTSDAQTALGMLATGKALAVAATPIVAKEALGTARKITPADVSRNNATTAATFSNDGTLQSFAVEANTWYLVEFALLFTCTANSGIKTQLLHPALPTQAAFNGRVFSTQTPTDAVANSATITTLFAITAARMIAPIAGYCRIRIGATGGNISLQWAQNVGHLDNTTLLQGSLMTVTKL